jgi:chromosome segregation ATPase
LEIDRLKEKVLKELNKNMTEPQTELIEKLRKLNILLNPESDFKNPINVDELVTNLVKKWEEKENDIKLLNENLVELEEQITRLETVIEENEKEKKQIVERLKFLTDENQKLNEDLENEIILQQQKEEIIEELEENKKLNGEKIAKLRSEKTTLENSLTKLNNEIERSQWQVKHLEKELTKTQGEKKEFEKNVVAVRWERDDAKRSAQKAVENQSTLINQHEQEIEQKNKEIEEITDKSIEQLGELEDVKAELGRAKKTISELEEEVKKQLEQINKYVITQSEHAEAQAENIKMNGILDRIAGNVDELSNKADLEENVNHLRKEIENIQEVSEKYRIQFSSLKEQLKRWGIEGGDFNSKNSWWNKIAKVSEVEKWKNQYERVAKELVSAKGEYQEINPLLLTVKSLLGIELGELDKKSLDEKKRTITSKIKNLQEIATKLKIYHETIVEKFGSQKNGEPVEGWQEKLVNLVTKEEAEKPTEKENLLVENIKTLLGLGESDDLPNDWQHKLIKIDDFVRELKIEKGTKTDEELKNNPNFPITYFAFSVVEKLGLWESEEGEFFAQFSVKNLAKNDDDVSLTKLEIWSKKESDLESFSPRKNIVLAIKNGQAESGERIISFVNCDENFNDKRLKIRNFPDNKSWELIYSEKAQNLQDVYYQIISELASQLNLKNLWNEQEINNNIEEFRKNTSKKILELKENGKEEEYFTFIIKNEKEEVFSFDEHWRSWKIFFLEPFIYKNQKITKLVIYQQQYTDELSLFVSNSEITLAVKKGLLNQLDESQPDEEIIDFQTNDDEEGSAKTLIIKNYVQRDDLSVNTWKIISSKKNKEVLTTNHQKGLNNDPGEVNQKLDELNNEINLRKTEITKLKEQKKNAEKVNITLGIISFMLLLGLLGTLVKTRRKIRIQNDKGIRNEIRTQKKTHDFVNTKKTPS